MLIGSFRYATKMIRYVSRASRDYISKTELVSSVHKISILIIVSSRWKHSLAVGLRIQKIFIYLQETNLVRNHLFCTVAAYYLIYQSTIVALTVTQPSNITMFCFYVKYNYWIYERVKE